MGWRCGTVTVGRKTKKITNFFNQISEHPSRAYPLHDFLSCP